MESNDWLPDAITGRQYLIFEDRMLHENAVQKCADYGAQLLKLNNSEVFSFIEPHM